MIENKKQFKTCITKIQKKNDKKKDTRILVDTCIEFINNRACKYADMHHVHIKDLAKKVLNVNAEYELLSSAKRKKIVSKCIENTLATIKTGDTVMFRFSRSCDVKRNSKEFLLSQLSGNIKTYIKYVLKKDQYKSKRKMCSKENIYCQLIS